MERDNNLFDYEEKKIAKMESDRQKGKLYLKAFLISVAMLFLLSTIYIVTAQLAIRIKYPNYNINENKEIYAGVLSIIQMISELPIIVFFVYIFKKDILLNAKDFKKKALKYIGIIFLGLFLCLFLTAIVSTIYGLLGIVDTSENQEIINTVLGGKAWLPMAISVVFIAPFAEEMIFRKSLCGLCQYEFKLNPKITLAISTFIFALIHVSTPGNFIFIFQYIPLAFVITYSYYHTGNIFVPMGIHFLNNLLSVVAFFLPA